MPTYEYACESCGNRFDVVQRFSDDPLTVCASCGGVLKKVFHPAGILFKGSGFYATDSRSGAAKPAGTRARDAGSGSSKGEGSTSSSSSSPSSPPSSGSPGSSSDAGAAEKSA